MNNLALHPEPQTPTQTQARIIPEGLDADHQDRRDRKRREREDRLDRFERDEDPRTRASWP